MGLPDNLACKFIGHMTYFLSEGQQGNSGEQIQSSKIFDISKTFANWHHSSRLLTAAVFGHKTPTTYLEGVLDRSILLL